MAMGTKRWRGGGYGWMDAGCWRYYKPPKYIIAGVLYLQLKVAHFSFFDGRCHPP